MLPKTSPWTTSSTPGSATPAPFPVAGQDLVNVDSKSLPVRIMMNPNTDNLIPNPTSELGALPSWEGVLVILDATNAYAGSYCRRLSLAATNETALCPPMPCFYGDQFSFDCYAMLSNAGGAAALVVKFLDSAGSVVGTVTSPSFNVTSYAIQSIQGSAPSGTQAMQAFVKTTTTIAANYAYFDNLSLRRSVKFSHMEGDAGFRGLNALKNSGTTTADRTWYAGNNDPGTKGGAPAIGTLTVTRRRWDTTNKIGRLELKMQPTAASDNLDGMRFAKVVWYRQSAAGTSGTLTAIDTTYHAIPDRLFANTSDSNAANASFITADLNDAGVSSGFPAVLVTLYNAFGPSDTHCFYAAAANADGSVLTDNGISWPAGLSGGSGGGSGGGGGGGGSCVTPDTLIDLPGGKQKAAGDIRAGDLVWTIHSTGTVGAWPVLQARMDTADTIYTVVFDDNLTLRFAKNHRLRLRGGGWVSVQDLQPGDVVDGEAPQGVVSVTPGAGGDVVAITVDKAHTYQTNGLLSSNLKILE